MDIRTLPLAIAALGSVAAHADDPRIREVRYDPAAVISVDTRRGAVTHIELAPDEAIRFVYSGQGADCRQPALAWCVDAPAGQANVFAKPKLGATPNTLAIVTDKRSYAFVLNVLPEGSVKPPVLRLAIRPALTAPAEPARTQEQLTELRSLLAQQATETASQAAQAVLEARLHLRPEVVNADYAVAVGELSGEITPAAVYDDGRFTYLRFPGNRELPAVFQVAEDGSESMVNARMEDDTMVVDRVSRRLNLRRNEAVVAVLNEAFDLDGRPPVDGTTAPGVQRVLTLNGQHPQLQGARP